MNGRHRVLVAPIRSRSRSSMTRKTKDFLQKICYKKTASVDMTHFGFINDSKVSPVNLLMKPLREKLEGIFGQPDPSPTNTTVNRRNKKDARPGRPLRRKTKPQLDSETVINPKKSYSDNEAPKRRVHYADEYHDEGK